MSLLQKRFLALVSVGVIFLAGSVQAQEETRTLELSLADCQRLVLEQNYDLQLAREMVRQSENDLTQARAALLPFLGAEASYSRIDEPLAMMKENSFVGGFVVRQPIFVGGRLTAARTAAEHLREAEELTAESVEKELIFQTARAYWAIRVAEAFKGVADEAVLLLETHEREVGILLDAGAIPPIDHLNTLTALAEARRDQNSAENALDLSYSSLKNLLAIDLDQPIQLTEPLVRLDSSPMNLSELTEDALARRQELRALEAQESAAEQGIVMARGEYLPEIAVEGRYEYFDGTSRDFDGGDHWTIGLGASVPLWDWGTIASKVLTAESQRDQVTAQFNQMKDRVQFEVRRAYFDLDEARKNITVAETALTAAGEAYRMARIRYTEGVGTNTDVLDARISLTQAEANHAQAFFDHNVAMAALERATGAPLTTTSMEDQQ